MVRIDVKYHIVLSLLANGDTQSLHAQQNSKIRAVYNVDIIDTRNLERGSQLYTRVVK